MIKLAPRASEEYNFAVLFPEIAEEWDYGKNKDPPTAYAPYSNKKVWWKCVQGHEWQARISKRADRRGCPYCSGNKVGEDNNLAVEYPALFKEWINEKNKHTPYDYTPGSNAKVWWRCENGHEWEAVIRSRTRGIGCPYCAGNLATEENNLAVVFPEIASQWHPTKNGDLSPGDVTYGSNKQVWWQCENGHEWRASVKSMKNGYQCPYCSGRKACEDNNLTVTHPKLVEEWHPSKNGELKPSHFTSTMSDKVWWKCSQGHEWEAQINNRTIGGTGCPHCYDENRGDIYRAFAVKRVGSLAENYPDIAKEWHPTKNGDLRPSDVTPKSSGKVWWKCTQEHEWETQISHRTAGSGCPYCSGKLASPEYNLAVEYPDIAQEWNHEKNHSLPSEHTPHSGKKVWWICPEGHVYEASINDRTRGTGCPYCVGKQVDETNSLASLYPDIAKDWHPRKNIGLGPDQVTSGSGKKVWWMCPQGHEYESRIADRTKGVGCPYCSPKTSRIEIRILTELMTIFDNVIHGRIFGQDYECDIFLPKYNLGIEIDGYWHKDRTERDKEKLDYFKLNGITLIRVRDRRLALNESDIPYSENEKHIKIVKRLLEYLVTNIEFSLQDQLKIKSYLLDNKLKNLKEYRERTRYLNQVHPDKSLEALYPEIAREWDFEKNHPLVPSSFAPFSHRKVSWVCDKGHKWDALISSRTRGIGCPYCAGNLATEENNLAVVFPEIASQWHPTKNGDLSPGDVTYGSNKQVWWFDEDGREWQARVKHRTSHYNNMKTRKKSDN